MIGQAMAAFSGGRAPPVSMVIIPIRELMNRSDQPPVTQIHLSPQLCFSWARDIKGKYKNRQSQLKFNSYLMSDLLHVSALQGHDQVLVFIKI
jgi:hypothetical protein